MLSSLRPGQIVFASSLLKPHVGSVVIVRHGAKEKVKRVAALTPDSVTLHGDTPGASTDSRHFGPLPRSVIMAVVWYT